MRKSAPIMALLACLLCVSCAQAQHKLTVEIVGINKKAVKKHMFGLD